jgi:hypothetical protein
MKKTYKDNFVLFIVGFLFGFFTTTTISCESCSNCNVKTPGFSDVQEVNSQNNSFNTETYIWEDWKVSTNKTNL